MRTAVALVLLVASSCAYGAMPPLAGWSCSDVGTLYGNIAVERDAGRSLRDAVSWASDAVRRSIETESPANLDIEAIDVRAILAAIYHIHATPGISPAAHRLAAMERCFRGDRWPPPDSGRSRPTGVGT